MRKLSLITFLAAALISAFSCAKISSEDTNHLEEMAFEAWMKKYVVDEGIPVKKQANGIYIQFFDDGDQTADSARDTIVWLRMNYTAADLGKNVFATRSEDEALKQATFTPYTYYAPDYLFCGDENHNMITGQYYALKNDLIKPDGTTVKLGIGAKVRIYMPSYLAFGSSGYSDDQGYGGQYTLSGTRPVIQDIEVVEVVKYPIAREENLVIDYATTRWGLADTDTLAAGFYVDTIRFNQELAIKYGSDQSLPWDEKYALTADSTAKIWFVKKFLDGFVFDTNIDTVYNRFFNRRAMEGYYATTFSSSKEMSTTSVMSYNPKDDEDNYVAAFYKAIPNLRKGQWSRIIFTSAYAYGATGVSAAVVGQQEYYNYYMNYLYNSSYYGSNSYYGNSYYNSYYSNYFNSSYYGYDTSSSDETTITTEIQPYTPLIFELYIEADDDE